MESRMNYEQFKIQSSPDGRGQDCVQYEQLGHTYLSCNLRKDQVLNELCFQDDLQITAAFCRTSMVT